MTATKQNPTWDDVRNAWEAMGEAKQSSFLSMVANCRPDHEFATRIAVYGMSVEAAVVAGAPDDVLRVVGTAVGYVDLSLVEPDLLGQGGIPVLHPTLGWFVVNPHADDVAPVLYAPDVPSEWLAVAFCMTAAPCCQAMAHHLNYGCGQHRDACPDRILRLSHFPDGTDRWLLVAPNAEYDVEFCPWCGARFQEPLKDASPGRRIEVQGWSPHP